MEAIKRFVDLMALVSSAVALLHFVVPESVLTAADKAVLRTWNWLDDHRYERFRQAAAQGDRDRLIVRFGIFCISLSFVVDGVFKISIKGLDAGQVPGFFLLNAIVTILSIAMFQWLGVPIVRWVFKSPRLYLTVAKAALMFGTSLIFTAVSLVLFAYFVQASTDPTGDKADAFYGFVQISNSTGVLYAATIAVIIVFVSLFVVLINNGVFTVVAAFYVYFLVIIWILWVFLHTCEYLLRRSIERKGAAALLAVFSGFLSAVLHWLHR